MWTTFHDSYSGGDQKTEWSAIYVELPEAEAVEWFEAKFNRHPLWVSCECCGDDFSITEDETPPEAGVGILIVPASELHKIDG